MGEAYNFDLTNVISDNFDYYDWLNYRSSVRLRASANLPIVLIKKFESQVFNSGKIRLTYEVNKGEPSLLGNDFLSHTISSSLMKDDTFKEKEYPISPLPLFLEEDIENKGVTLDITITSDLVIDNRLINKEDLVDTFKEVLNDSTYVNYVYTQKSTYQNYITVLSAHKKALIELKIEHLGEEFSNQDLWDGYHIFSQDSRVKKEKERLDKLYPFLLIETFKEN